MAVFLSLLPSVLFCCFLFFRAFSFKQRIKNISHGYDFESFTLLSTSPAPPPQPLSRVSTELETDLKGSDRTGPLPGAPHSLHALVCLHPGGEQEVAPQNMLMCNHILSMATWSLFRTF